MGNETSKAIYQAKIIENYRKSKLKKQKQQHLDHQNEVNKRENQMSDDDVENVQVYKQDDSSNSYVMENQEHKAEETIQDPISIKKELRDYDQSPSQQIQMKEENNGHLPGDLNLQQFQKIKKQAKQYDWRNYEGKATKKMKMEQEIIQISDEDQNGQNDQSQNEQSSSSDSQQMINEAQFKESSQINEMIEQIKERVRQQRRIKLQSQEKEKIKKLKLEYNESIPEDIGVFLWDGSRDSSKELQLPEQQQLLLKLEKEFSKSGNIKTILLEQKIQQKVYLKSIDILAVDFNYDLFSEVKELEHYEDDMKIKIMSKKQVVQSMEEGKSNDRSFMMNQGGIRMESSNIAQNDEQNSFDRLVRPLFLRIQQQRAQDNYWFGLFLGDFSIGKSIIIENTKYQNTQFYMTSYFESLKFLLQHEIIQIQTVKVYLSPYAETDLKQIYLHTRGSSDPLTSRFLIQKTQAQFAASFPLTFNMHNYYRYVCEQRAKSNINSNNKTEQQIFSISNQTKIFGDIGKHLKKVLNHTTKSEWDDTLKNRLLEKWRVLSQRSIDEQDKEEQEDPQDDFSYQIEEKKLLKENQQQNNNKIPNKEIPKQQLEQLFQSGKWFSLDSTKVQAVNPTKFFNGSLKHYQQLTLGWMLYRENCPINYRLQIPQKHYNWKSIRSTGNRLFMNQNSSQIMNYLPKWKKNVSGGMLCDEMGLGKTVMMLSLIDKHVRSNTIGSQSNDQLAGTLIIVPTTVLLQWQAKIKEFVPHLTYIIILKGKNLTKKEILKSHIVLTTFGIIRSQRKAQHNKCTIYDFRWLRVIVDEADNLRNHKTYSARGIQQIPRQFTWLLTGTPIQNKLSDLQSYFNILSYKHNKLIKSTMKKGFIKSNQCLILLKESLKDIMVRRKKNTLDQFGKPLLQLKNFKWVHKVIEFTEQQQEIYDSISLKIVNEIEKILEQDKEYQEWDEKKPRLNRKIDLVSHQNIENVFCKLMKLRQFCCHPQLLNSKSNFIKYEDFHKHFSHFCEKGYDMNALKKGKTEKKRQMRNIFQRIFLNARQVKQQEVKKKIYDDIMSRKQLICSYCQGVIKNGLITICLHPYCDDCFKQEWVKQKKNVDRFQYGQRQIERRYMNCAHGDCSQKIYHRQTLQLPRINRFNKEISQILPNKKINNLIEEIRKTQANEKIVVYTHFIGMLEILMQTFDREFINALDLTGSDSIQQRGDKYRSFKENQGIKVMVISTKCGYAGLNLQFANKIYFMEPWWNPAVEDQALGRLHRYGQENEVESTRFLMKDSIEEVINIMGRQKKLLSDFVLDSDSFKKRKKKIQILKEFKRQLATKTKLSKEKKTNQQNQL